MKLRHTVVLTLTGWFIMMPPHPDSVREWETFSSKAPLADWVVFKSFAPDKQKECMVEAKRIRDNATKDLNDHKPGQLESLALQQARCYSADDVRSRGGF